MNADMNRELVETGLTAGYEAAPATFEVALPPVGLPVGGRLAEGVRLVNGLHAEVGRLGEGARQAAKRHLFASLSLGCVLARLTGMCRAAGVQVKALFADFKGSATARAGALRLTGGRGMVFTYRTGRNYVRLYEEMRRRMELGMEPGEVRRVLEEHASRLLAGGYEDVQGAMEGLWGPFVSAEGVRQAYLELAPRREAASVGEVLEAALERQRQEGAEARPGGPSWEARRVRLCQRFGGFFSSLDAYIERMSMFTTSADREAQAAQLEEAARRLRAMRSQAGAALPKGALPLGDEA